MGEQTGEGKWKGQRSEGPIVQLTQSSNRLSIEPPQFNKNNLIQTTFRWPAAASREKLKCGGYEI